MIGKVSSFVFVLFIIGCCGIPIDSVNDSKSIVELYVEAEEACNFTYENLKRSRDSPSDLFCPIHCILSKLGIINKGGLNKILVNWTRKLIELEITEKIFNGSLRQFGIFENQSSDVINSRLDTMFYKIRNVNDKFEELCSINDKATRNIRLISLLMGSQSAFNDILFSTEKQPVYIPSAENSRSLQLIQDAEQKCMSHFNVTVALIIRGLKTENKTVPNRNICTKHCMYSELGIFHENGLIRVWIDSYRKMYQGTEKLNELEAAFEEIKKELPILNSYCSMLNPNDADIEVSENNFRKARDKIWVEVKKLTKESESSTSEAKDSSDYPSYT